MPGRFQRGVEISELRSNDEPQAPTAVATTGTDAARSHRWRVLAWHVLAAFLVVVVPMMLRLGLPFWAVSPPVAFQAGVLGIAYLLFATLHASRRWMEPPGSPGRAAVTWTICFGTSVGLMLVLPDLNHSRILLAIAFALGSALAVGPDLLGAGRPFDRGLAALGIAALGASVWSIGMPGGPTGSVAIEHSGSAVVAAGAHAVRIRHHSGLGPQPAQGGGIALAGAGRPLLVSSSVGELYRLRLNGASLDLEPVALPSPVNRDDFIEDNPAAAEHRHFRVMDLLVDTLAAPPRLLLSHYSWNRDDRCVSIRVSTTPLPGEGDPDDGRSGWDTLFDSSPCLPFAETDTVSNHAGGSLARAPGGGLLVTVGDMDRSGIEGGPVPPQDDDTDYGKIHRIGPDGQVEVHSKGHRNPEGLAVGRDGSVWSTEHGPRGGDELNLVVAGRNYGWPFATYGTQADQSPVSLAGHSRDHGPYEEPVFVWVPSVGISGLIELRGHVFPDWEGDLLVASLNGGTLYRVRVRRGRVVYAEPLWIGHRVRDLVETARGLIVLYTDEGEVVTLEPTGSVEASFAIYCGSCHQSVGGTPGVGPDLRGVFGRRAGSVPGYDYSPALEALDVTWDETTLDAFLAAPQDVAPGTTMRPAEMDESDREAIIEYLRTFR